MAGARPRRQVRAPNRLGWEEEDLGECVMDSDSDDIAGSDSDSDSDSDNDQSTVNSSQASNSQQSSEQFSSQSTAQSSVDSDPEDREAGWVDEDSPPVIPPYTGQPGVLQHLPADAREVVDFFEMILNNEFFELLSRETNRYAEQVIEATAELPPHSRLRQWKEVTPNEMRSFVAILLSMGIDDRPTYASYWSTSEIFANTFWPSIMPRDRFLIIQRFFHLSNNAADHNAGDKLRKIRPMIDFINRKFPELYYPQRDIGVDETMVPWTGRLSFKQYIPIKPDKYGVKLYQLCESRTGYTYSLEVYCGKDGNNTDDVRGHSHAVVMRLCQPLLGKGHILWVDNYYTGIPLFEELESLDTCAAGTLRLNRRGIPNAVKRAALGRGEMIFRRRDNLLALKWKDKKDVSFLSTAHTAEMTQSLKRKDANGDPALVPAIKEQYDKNMNAVDRNDQNVSLYAARRKSAKWYKKLAYHLIDLCRFQAYVLYSKETPSPLSQLDFIHELVLGLLERGGVNVVNVGRPCQGNPIQRLVVRHFPDFVPPTEKKTNATRRCVVCSIATGERRKACVAAPRRKESRYMCKECDVGLCVVPCFQLYHTHKDFKAAFRGLQNLHIDE